MEKETQEAVNRLELTNEQVHSALIELLMLVQELKVKVDNLEKWYDSKYPA